MIEQGSCERATIKKNIHHSQPKVTPQSHINDRILKTVKKNRSITRICLLTY